MQHELLNACVPVWDLIPVRTRPLRWVEKIGVADHMPALSFNPCFITRVGDAINLYDPFHTL